MSTLKVSNQVTRRSMLTWLSDQLRAASSRVAIENDLTSSHDDPMLDLLSLAATYVENDPEVALAFVEDQLTEPLLAILNACQVGTGMISTLKRLFQKKKYMINIDIVRWYS